MEAAKALYEAKWKHRLECDHFGEVIAIEPESCEYVLGATFLEADRQSQGRFGTKPIFFRIGGGGAVRIRGVTSRERLLTTASGACNCSRIRRGELPQIRTSLQ